MARGLYRTKTEESGAEYARVDYGPSGGGAMDLPEAEYRMRGYEPPFERLPTKADLDRSFEVGFAPRGRGKIDIGYALTAKKILEEVRNLERSDEEIRYIKAPGGRRIELFELEDMAKKECGDA